VRAKRGKKREEEVFFFERKEEEKRSVVETRPFSSLQYFLPRCT